MSETATALGVTAHSKIAFIAHTDHQDVPESEWGVYATLADRLDAGESITQAMDHMTRQQISFASRMVCSNRPLVGWYMDPPEGSRGMIAAAAIRDKFGAKI